MRIRNARCCGAGRRDAVRPALAEEPELPERPQQNLFGMTWLIDMPSAEMQPDAQFTFTTSYFGGYHRNTASVQFLPGSKVPSDTRFLMRYLAAPPTPVLSTTEAST